MFWTILFNVYIYGCQIYASKELRILLSLFANFVHGTEQKREGKEKK